MIDTLMSRLVGALLVALLGVGLSACGSDDNDKESASGGGTKEARAVEKAFLTGMVHHHESAIDMAEIAKEKGKAPFITKLAGDIMTTQEQEIAEMKTIYQRLLGGKLKPDPGAHDGLGLSAAEAGMTHDAQTNQALRAADPFDRAFVDEMVPHHEGAVKMSAVVLKTTKDADLRRLADGIVSTQKREIKAMNAFRVKNFGGPVPAGAGHGGEHGQGKHKEEGKPAEKKEHGAGHSG